ncbi:MAG: [LysW]-lysine hydrolase [Chloroflexota bacterium]
MNEFETLTGLVSRYSPSGQEREAAEWLVGRMKTLGYTDAFVDGAGNAVGVMGAGARQVVLLGHIDTVAGEIELRVANSASDFPPASQDGQPIAPNVKPSSSKVLYGRGAVDAKGPLACFVDAVAQVGAVDGWQFVVIGAVEEERDSDGARFAADRYQPDFAIIGEPNQWDRITLGYKGSAWVKVTVRREQTHTASGEQTAAEAAVDAWLQIKSFVDAFNADKQTLFGKLLPTLRGMESGQDGFAQWARLTVGVRLPLEVSPDEWYSNLKALLNASDDDGVQVEPAGFPVPAWRGEKNNRLVRAFLSSIRSQGGEPRFVYKTGTADVNIVAPVWQCPAVVYGPGDSALDHTPHEHIDLEDYRRAVNVLAAALSALTD